MSFRVCHLSHVPVLGRPVEARAPWDQVLALHSAVKGQLQTQNLEVWAPEVAASIQGVVAKVLEAGAWDQAVIAKALEAGAWDQTVVAMALEAGAWDPAVIAQARKAGAWDQAGIAKASALEARAPDRETRVQVQELDPQAREQEAWAPVEQTDSTSRGSC